MKVVHEVGMCGPREGTPDKAADVPANGELIGFRVWCSESEQWSVSAVETVAGLLCRTDRARARSTGSHAMALIRPVPERA